MKSSVDAEPPSYLRTQARSTFSNAEVDLESDWVARACIVTVPTTP
jgi:hypothetical protein